MPTTLSTSSKNAGKHLSGTSVFGHQCLDISVWTSVFGHQCLGISVWTSVFLERKNCVFGSTWTNLVLWMEFL